MRAVLVDESDKHLHLGEVPDPTPRPDEVLIRVAASAVNRADLLQADGHYPPPPGASTVLGLECSGTIESLGDAVTGWNVGDRVCALLSGGGYAELAAVPATQLMRIPEGVDLVTAASLPETACTVWSMVFDHARLGVGESFLVHGGSSGIGTMAIQLAAAQNCRVFATAGNQEKLDACRALGADVVVNYRHQNFREVIAKQTDHKGVDVILDTIGAKYLPDNVASLAVGGRLSVIGMLGGRKGELDLGRLLTKRGTIYAASLRARPMEEKAAIVAGTEAHVWPLVEQRAVRPVVHAVVPMAHAHRAHQMVWASEHVGKVVLSIE